MSNRSKNMVSIACVQMASPASGAKQDRIDYALSLIDRLPPVDLIVLPELWPVGFFQFDKYEKESESLEESKENGVVAAVAEAAARKEAFVVGGSFVERAEQGRFHNTSFLVGPDGELLETYRKMHVFGYRSREAELLTGGGSIAVAKTGVGTVGFTTCYDLRFPELYRALVDAGAQVVIVPAAWPMERLEHWLLLNRVRAIENQTYMVACNTAGVDNGTALAGNSMVVGPQGEIIARAGAEEQALVADVDMERLRLFREEFPVLKDRRLGAEGEQYSYPISFAAERGSQR